MDHLDVVMALDATVIPDPMGPGQNACSTCGRITDRSRAGHPALCRPCTEVEIGEETQDLVKRVSRRMTRAQYAALPVDSDGQAILPSLNNRQWRRLHS